jgi:hypothetical protein
VCIDQSTTLKHYKVVKEEIGEILFFMFLSTLFPNSRSRICLINHY